MEDVWRDDPLTTKDGDQLGTRHVAQRTATLIQETHSFDSSTVIGLAGPWGSGKSSIAAMTIEALTDNAPDWAIARFTPWATSDVDGMMADFYAALAGALPSERARGLKRKLASLARLGTPALKLVPTAGATLSELARNAADSILEQPSWDEAFTEASDRLANLRIPVLVVIDDVDRLQLSELVALLRLVRLLGRFPGVSYLLAYDEQTLLANLQTAELGVGSSAEARLFLEKVVQYPVSVPPLVRHQVLVPLEEGLNRVYRDLQVVERDYDTRLGQLADVYVTQLRTPRSLHRFLAQVRFTLSLHDPGEIDAVDLTLLTLLRVQFPELYHQLPSWKPELTGAGHSRRTPLGSSSREVDLKDLLNLAPAGLDRDDALEILGILFPRIGEQWLTAGTRQSVREGSYFDRYFVNTVHQEDVPDHVVAGALRDAQDEPSERGAMRELLTTGSITRRALALRRMHVISQEHLENLDPGRLLCAVMAMTEHVNSNRAMFDNPRELLTFWAAKLITLLPKTVRHDDLLACLASAPSLQDQLHVLWRLRDEENLPSAVADVARQMCDQALSDVLDHLRAGDRAPQGESVVFRLLFIQHFGDPQAARHAIHEVLKEEATGETLASRFVSVATAIGVPNPRSSIVGFDQHAFSFWAPLEDELYSTQRVPHLDEDDVSWENRRKCVRGQASPPARDQG
ncbi:P-loop NTPase fold protein [Serinicoccus sp. LYQ131]|uniref:P-loop NTPase fold protein n=1 Tax=Serinicoccus sp. LYQ131 TaxID=3378797 RepID=UPI0038521BE8